MEQDHGTASSLKKSNKPQMEKKRRERINNSLNELKSLILGAMKKDAGYYSKLEKADILEMAVEHVKNLQKQLRAVQTSDAHPMARYRSGFITCATEVTRLLMGLPGLDENIKFSVIKHLASCCSTSPIETTADSVTVPAIEPTNIISQVSSTEIIQPINSTGQSIDGRTIEQKRLMYQRLITQGATPTYKVKEQGHVITSTDHSQPKPTDTHSCLAGKHEHILKPIPQLPSQALFGNGVKLMPATVLVPVPVTFPNAVKQESAAKTEVWRPW